MCCKPSCVPGFGGSCWLTPGPQRCLFRAVGRVDFNSLETKCCQVLVAWFLSSAPAGRWNMCCQGRLGNTWELLSSCAHSSRHNSSWNCAHREGGKYKCLFGNVSPTCARPFPCAGGSLLTSPYPQGDAAPMGAPGEKGPNGLPVSMEQDLPPLGVPAAQGACRNPSWGQGRVILWAVAQGALVKPRGNALFPPCRQGRSVPERTGEHLEQHYAVIPWLLAALTL